MCHLLFNTENMHVFHYIANAADTCLKIACLRWESGMGIWFKRYLGLDIASPKFQLRDCA
jgi:hypothetical protein